LFLGSVDDDGLSLNFWDFATIANPTKPYPSLEAFYADIRGLLNDTGPGFAFYPQLTTHELDGNAQTSMDYTFAADKDGLIYYVVIPFDDPEPSVAEVINGTAGGGAAVASGNGAILTTDTTVTILGLSAGTVYDLYSVTTDTPGAEIVPSTTKLSQTTQP
jgi:hypothetical protein